jgi:oxaloacetate decarboxylase (Na+ extruding) subunit gamma
MDFALLLLLVGMITVFIALALVVFVGNATISFINKYVPEKVKAVAQVRQTSSSFDKRKMAAIITAVDIATNGKGKVMKIEKQ